MSTSVSVVFVLVGEFKVTTFDKVLDGETARGDCNVPLSRAGKIFVRVLVAVRWDDDGDDDDGEKLPFRKRDGILNDDEIDADVIEEDDD
jgi:hypothetical protein